MIIIIIPKYYIKKLVKIFENEAIYIKSPYFELKIISSDLLYYIIFYYIIVILYFIDFYFFGNQIKMFLYFKMILYFFKY